MTTIDNLIIHSTQEFGYMQMYHELYPFTQFYSNLDCKNILEIGTYMGGMFSVMCKLSNLYGKKISIDYPFYDGQQEEMKKRNVVEKMKKLAQNVILITGDSHSVDVKNNLSSVLNGEKLDFIFIDGDHTYNGVKSDFQMYKEFVKKGGYIGFHDILDTPIHRQYNCYVATLWNEIKKEYDNIYEFTSNCQSCGIGVVQML